MKSKSSSSIYEVLRHATRPSGEGVPAAETPEAPAAPGAGGEAAEVASLQERLAAYKAAKLASVAPPAATATAEAPASRDADPSPVPARSEPARQAPVPMAAPAAPSVKRTGSSFFRGMGERAFRVTYNTAVFAALVGIGMLFIAYAIGMQAGRARATSEAAAESPLPPPPQLTVKASEPAPPPPPPPPPPTPKVYTILLAEWAVRTPQERLKADDQAEQMKKGLLKAGLGTAEVVKIQRGNEARLALYLGRFTNLAGEPAKAKLASAQRFKFGTQTPFAKAMFEEVPK